MSSEDYRNCVKCQTPRLTSTLDSFDVCVFCNDEEESTRKQRIEEDSPPPPVKPSEPPPQIEPVHAVQGFVDDAYQPPKHVAHKDWQQELADTYLAEDSLLHFIQRFRPKYLAGWVHKDICRRLERFVRDVEAGKSPRMLIMMPPRSGKSEIGSRHLPAWVLGNHPEWEIIAASHTASLTLSFSRYNRDLLNDPAYHSVFPDTRLDPNSKSVENWNLTKGGGYLAAGVGTGITGRGAHILLLDDLVKDIEAADSPTISDNTWEWYGSTAYTRLAPGGGVLGIMTWWSESDWAGRIQSVMESGDGDVFEIVKYPAINEEGDEYLLPDDTIRQYGPDDDPPPPSATLVRPRYTAVHPARYDTEAMYRIKKNLIATGQKRVWQALYQQNPVPDDGLFFTKEMFKYAPSVPPKHRCHIYQAWDFAITEKTESDYTVGSTIMQDEHDNLYVVDVRRFRSSDSGYIIDMILDYAQEWNATLLGFEDGQIWKTMLSQFEKRCSERKYYPSYEVLKPLTDKMVRAHPLRGRMQAGKIWFFDKQPWLPALVNEMTRFPASKHDDQIDSLAWTVRLTLGRHAPKPPAPPKNRMEKSWKTKIPGLLRGSRGASHMSA